MVIKTYLFLFLILFLSNILANDAGTISNIIANEPPQIDGFQNPEEQSKSVEEPPDLDEFSINSISLDYSFEIDSNDLRNELKKHVNKKYGQKSLKNLISELQTFFRQKYLWVNITVPDQDLNSGVLRLVALEPKLAHIDSLISEKVRFEQKKLEHFIDTQITSGEAVSLMQLDKTIKTLDHLHGVKAAGLIKKGSKPNTSNFSVIIEPDQLVKGSLSYDTFGTKAIGRERAKVNLNTNSLFNQGERIDLSLMKTQEMEYYSAGLIYPIGLSNYSLKLNANNMNYALGQPFEALGAKGDSQNYSIGMNKVHFGQETSLTFDIDYVDRNFYNETVAGETSDKSINALSLAMTYEFDDDHILQSMAKNLINLTFINGRLDLSDNADNLESDQASSKKHGNFKKIGFNILRLQRFNKLSNHYLKLNLRGQAAFDNLDNSEKIYLGGPFGVRAYPVAEAMGDRGVIMNVEWHQFITSTIQTYYFYDVGKIDINHHPWSGWNASNPEIPNSYTLQGAGLGFMYRPSFLQDTIFDLSYAHKIGTNAGQTSLNKDNDLTSSKSRLWLNISKEF